MRNMWEMVEKMSSAFGKKRKKNKRNLKKMGKKLSINAYAY